jgi:hypothetical protein
LSQPKAGRARIATTSGTSPAVIDVTDLPRKVTPRRLPPLRRVESVRFLPGPIGTLLIAAPAAIAIGFGKRSEAVLAGMRTWLDAHGHAVVLGTLLVLGAWLVGTGLSGLRR